jgi:hypothetical protein
MAFEGMDGSFGIVASMNVKWGESNCAAVCSYCCFQVLWSLIVEDIPVYMDDMRVFPTLVDSAISCDKVIGVM